MSDYHEAREEGERQQRELDAEFRRVSPFNQELPLDSAFPSERDWHGGKLVSYGMTLRDYFAAKSMHATITKARLCDSGGDDTQAGAMSISADELQRRFDKIAASAYAMADAMLKARVQP